MRVYIAAPYSCRDRALALLERLTLDGVACTSCWLTDPSETLTDEWARKDLADVARCDALVAYNPPEWAEKGTGGRHVEFGYALALRKPIIILGVRSNIFHHLSDVSVVDDVSEIAGLVADLALAGW